MPSEEWKRRNADKIREYHAQYRKEHSNKIRQYQDAYRKENREHLSASKSEYYSKRAETIKKNRKEIKLKVMIQYGNEKAECVLCPESRLGALHIDHIDGNSKEHRKNLSGDRFYKWLIKENPTGFRTLCANCNWREHLRLRILSQTKKALIHRAENKRLKTEFMAALGGVCVGCGIDDLDILTASHIEDDGADHRNKVSAGKGGKDFYKIILELNDFTGLECLCFSCNDCKEMG